MKELGLYIHIPFCKKKCLYCDFPSYAQCDAVYETYINALCQEIGNGVAEYADFRIKSVFIGGGTPSVLPPKLLGKVMTILLDRYHIAQDAEITIETNPGTLDYKKLKEYKAMEINRLSMGVQAVQNRLLQCIGRIHDIEAVKRNYSEARDTGFQNINMDLMFSLPSQTISDWEETLETVIKMKPQHISAYSLIIEEGTPFQKLYDDGRLILPDEETDRKMYRLAIEMLQDADFQHYEISNFAQKGFNCRHNEIYWMDEEYIGYGLGAHSYFQKERFSNTGSLQDYIEAKGHWNCLRQGIEKINLETEYAEFMFMGLRMLEGVSNKRFEKRFGKGIEEVYKEEIDSLIENRLLMKKGDCFALTKKGIDISNQVFGKFLK